MSRKHVGNGQIELVQGDITDQKVDTIVNAANSQLAGGGGVDGAIHRRGGPSIMQETSNKYPNGCQTGSAVITGAGNLRATYVIHAVGPVWRGGHAGEAESLASAYDRCLSLASQHVCSTIAFPSLSTGAYGYPMNAASAIAIDRATEFLEKQEQVKLIRFVLFDKAAFDVFATTLTD